MHWIFSAWLCVGRLKHPQETGQKAGVKNTYHCKISSSNSSQVMSDQRQALLTCDRPFSAIKFINNSRDGLHYTFCETTTCPEHADFLLVESHVVNRLRLSHARR